MTEEELRTVPYFTIENQYGRIEFVGNTDLTEVDLSELVTIKKGKL
jgi:hypothetical protein